MSFKYLLLADDDQGILNIQETALKYFYGGEILVARTKDEALAILEKHGKPEIIFIEFEFLIQNSGELHSYLEKNKYHIPIVASSMNPETHEKAIQFPMVSVVLDKPISVDAFTYLVKGITTAPVSSPGYVPVKIETVLEHGIGDFDFFLKLSGTNYVKIINKEDHFSKAHAEKLQSKGIQEVHIKASDSHGFLKIWEDNLKTAISKKNISTEEKVSIAMETLEQLEGISKALGWSREVILDAQKTIAEAVKILGKNSDLSEALKKRMSNPASNFAMHVSMLSYLSCCLYSHISPSVEGGQMKLAMASLLHDLSVDESHYKDIDTWNKRAANSKDKNAETVKYRLHPLEASKHAQSLDVLPPDVDQIILQHHETKDGKGFPRALTASRISFLSSLFIMSEDLVEFVLRGEQLETSIKDYLVWGEYFYDEGHFKKIFDVIKTKLP